MKCIKNSGVSQDKSLFCPPAEQLGNADEMRAVSRVWAFARQPSLFGHSNPGVLGQEEQLKGLAAEVQLGWAVCAMPGHKEGLGTPSEGPALPLKWHKCAFSGRVSMPLLFHPQQWRS